MYHAGDTGYSNDFIETKKRLGAPKYAFLPIGAYDPEWFMSESHVNPEDSVKIMNDLEAVAATFSSPVGRYPNCDESGEALLKFKSGVVASIAAGWVDLAMPLTAEVSGTKAYAYVIKNDLYLVSDDIEDANANTPFKDVPESLPHAFDLFLDSVHSGESTNLVTTPDPKFTAAL